MREINLTQGLVAIVDDAEFDALSRFKWYADVCGPNVYAATYIDGVKVRLHALLVSGGDVVDHRNGNTLDNRKSNLRACTHSQNMQNSTKRCDAQTSQFKGVCYRAERNKWRARIKLQREVFLGHFNSEIEAAIAYNRAASEHFGEFARLNDVSSCGNG